MSTELAGLIFGFVAQVIANVAATPILAKRYPGAMTYLNFVGATFNTMTAAFLLFTHKPKPAVIAAFPSGNRPLRTSYVVSLVGCLLGLATTVAELFRGRTLWWFAAVASAVGLVALIRVTRAVMGSGPWADAQAAVAE